MTVISLASFVLVAWWALCVLAQVVPAMLSAKGLSPSELMRSATEAFARRMQQNDRGQARMRRVLSQAHGVAGRSAVCFRVAWRSLRRGDPVGAAISTALGLAVWLGPLYVPVVVVLFAPPIALLRTIGSYLIARHLFGVRRRDAAWLALFESPAGRWIAREWDIISRTLDCARALRETYSSDVAAKDAWAACSRDAAPVSTVGEADGSSPSSFIVPLYGDPRLN